MNGLDCNAWRRPLRHRLFWWFYEADVGLWVALVITVALAIIWWTA